MESTTVSIVTHTPRKTQTLPAGPPLASEDAPVLCPALASDSRIPIQWYQGIHHGKRPCHGYDHGITHESANRVEALATVSEAANHRIMLSTGELTFNSCTLPMRIMSLLSASVPATGAGTLFVSDSMIECSRQRGPS